MIQGEGFTVKESKLDYFFGRATSTPRNAKRSSNNLENLKKLGIDETVDGIARLIQIFQEGLNAPEIIAYRKDNEYGTSIARKVEVSGPDVVGAIIVSYYYPGGNRSVIPQVSSIITLIYK